MRDRSSRRGYAIAGIVVGLLALCSCSSSGAKAANPTTSTTAPRLLAGHTSWTETYVDTSRRTVPVAGAALPSRTLVTTIYRPNGKGPFPLIAFSHGLDGHPEKFTKLFTTWADAGFVIAAPAFPLTNSHAPSPDANVGDLAEQPADVSFVLDKVLALNNEQGSRLFRAIDERKIGAGGLSLGGLTTYKLVYGDCCRDERFDAAAVLDGIRIDDPVDGHVPLLIAHADRDPTIPYPTAKEVFTAASAPVWFMTFQAPLHSEQWENDVTPFDHIAEQTTLDFWTATLNGRSQAFAKLERDATVAGLSSIVAKK
jgi:dienelactone hydrolase